MPQPHNNGGAAAPAKMYAVHGKGCTVAPAIDGCLKIKTQWYLWVTKAQTLSLMSSGGLLVEAKHAVRSAVGKGGMSGPGGTRAGSGRRATGSGSSTRGRKGQVIGGYLIGEEIGKGAYGRVYKGINQRTGNVVAVKEVSLEGISDEDLRGIMSEIDLLKTLAHKNIVKYLSSAKSSQHLYIMLEFVENGSLSNFIRPSRFGAFPESLVVLYISQVLEGLAYLHDQGVIHRDIKGANILTTKQGLVKYAISFFHNWYMSYSYLQDTLFPSFFSSRFALIQLCICFVLHPLLEYCTKKLLFCAPHTLCRLADFGVATRLSTERSKQHVVGTPYWMSPEMIEMKEVTTLSDIWSVGCTVIELLTSEPPYHDLEPMQALYNIVNNERPPLPNGISDLLADFLKQCFHKDQRKRPTARTLLQHPWIQKMQNDLKRSWPRQKRRPSQTDNGATKKSTEEHLLPQFSQDEQSAFHQQHQQRQYQPQPQQKNGVTTVIQRMLEHEEQQGMQENMGSRNEAEGNYEYDPEVGRRLASWLENVGSASAEEERSSRTSVRDGTETVMTNATSRDNTSRTATAKTVTSKGGDSDELRRLLAQLRPEKRESALTAACEKLAAHSASASETKAMQIALQATQPLAVLLEHSNLQVQEAALAVAEKLAAAGESPLFYLSLLGLLPPLIKLCASGNPSQVRLPAARTISHVSATRRTVEMLIACQATPKLVELFEEDYKGVNIDLAQVGLEVMTNILSLQEVAPIDTDAFMQLLARGRLPDRLSKSLESMSFANDEDVRLSEQGNKLSLIYIYIFFFKKERSFFPFLWCISVHSRIWITGYGSAERNDNTCVYRKCLSTHATSKQASSGAFTRSRGMC